MALSHCWGKATSLGKAPSLSNHWDHRRQASSHRYSTSRKAGTIPVGAGLPAKGPQSGPGKLRLYALQPGTPPR
ncbi:hypothetical protein DBB42_24780 [Pseudomonas plecoglossicida]|uniref:Uncharacterized protein n=1 Tax=Pseudomonas plecoglossicida TaxID=70775 RepID=A0A2R7UCX5_PSEDL|nr:hypothetical protein DBB42_24780 [Pseudomonas plecoglossicida]